MFGRKKRLKRFLSNIEEEKHRNKICNILNIETKTTEKDNR